MAEKVLFARDAQPGELYRDANPRLIDPKIVRVESIHADEVTLAVYVHGYNWCEFKVGPQFVLRQLNRSERKLIRERGTFKGVR